MSIGDYKRQLQLKPLLQTKQVLRLVGRIKLAELIELNEKDFARIIKNIERDPLFRKLSSPYNRQEKVISYLCFPRSGLAKNFYHLKESTTRDRSFLEVESLLDGRKETIPLIRRLGIDKFKKYFLYNSGDISYKDISRACKLREKDVMKIMAVVDDLAIRSEFFNSLMIDSGSNLSYSRVAQIEKDKSGEFFISFLSPYLAKGRYSIDYEKLAELKRKGVFSRLELKKLDRLVKDLEAINTRKSIVYRVLRKILKKQSLYFATGDPRNLIPLTQRELAIEMGINPSLISRGIARRSIYTPWQEEYPLKYFFPSRKKIVERLIADIISGEKCVYTDAGVRDRLEKIFNIDISRRSVASYRKKIKIPPYLERIRSLNKRTKSYVS